MIYKDNKSKQGSRGNEMSKEKNKDERCLLIRKVTNSSRFQLRKERSRHILRPQLLFLSVKN